MKLIMPAKTINNFDYNAMMNVNSLRGIVQNAARRLEAEIVECDYEEFVKYSFVGEAYRIALYHALYADDISDVKNYLSRCVEVFQGEREEMAFVDGEFPDYVRAGFDKLLTNINKKLEANGVSGAFGNVSPSYYDKDAKQTLLH
ncbi:hypothetical protein STRATTON_141 [Erwinia phage vB_EamM_Stratton]|uniref:Uncharacterized protein n=1 Tax=Erwinia phage vB_EamM_Stratton TaxID=1883378 RepID=A0A1B2IH23_9CAUD|nr:hypothetical protein STRATTON_141 [Erwinia phage vB_EamM_Stratton]